ncbi:MAG: hypothetical protein SNJ82_10280, partial [Gemmataceae bacterium]
MIEVRFSCLWVLLAVAVVRSADPEPTPPPSEEMLKKWSGLSAVVVGKLTEVMAGPVAPSFPPLYNHRLTVDVEQVLVGKLN